MDRKTKKEISIEKQEQAIKNLQETPPEKGDFKAMIFGALLALMPAIILILAIIVGIALLFIL
jgi:ribonuclease PH